MNNFLNKSQAETEKLFETRLVSEIENHFQEIERIKLISKKQFLKQYVVPGKPVILTGITEKWPAMTQWNFEFFQRTCGDLTIKTNLYDVSRSEETTMRLALDRIIAGQKRTYLQEWWFGADHPSLEKDFTIPNYFSNCAARELFQHNSHILFMGSRDSSTYVHQDTIHTNIWSAQIVGEKRWILFGRKAHMPILSDGSANVETFLKDPNSEIMHCRLMPGEILFIPYKWWHRVDIIEDSISLHSLFVTRDILSAYVKDLLAITLSTALNQDLLLEKNKMRLDVNRMSCRVFAKLMGFNVNDILGVGKNDKNIN